MDTINPEAIAYWRFTKLFQKKTYEKLSRQVCLVNVQAKGTQVFR